jgi:hypothetical protein
MPTSGSLDKIEEDLPENLSAAEKISAIDRALSWAPLDWLLYFRRGLIGLDHPDIYNHSEADFNRVLFFEQSTVEIPTYIGDLYIHRDFSESMRAWRQLLQRQTAAYKRNQFFEFIDYPNLNENERYEITTLAGDDPELQVTAILYQNSSDFNWYFPKLLEKNPSLHGVSDPILRQVFDRWCREGDVDKFIKEWPLHPEWQEAGWRAYARALAKTGHERDAVMTALRCMTMPDMPHLPAPQDLDYATNQFQANPQDPFLGILLYSAQKSRGLNDQAIGTLLTLIKLPQHPSYIPYLLAKDLLQANQDKAAWQVLDPVLDDQ